MGSSQLEIQAQPPTVTRGPPSRLAEMTRGKQKARYIYNVIWRLLLAVAHGTLHTNSLVGYTHQKIDPFAPGHAI